MAKKTPRVLLSREGKVLGEYHLLQVGSMLETGHLKNDDLCFDPGSNEWIPIRRFLQRTSVPEYARHSQRESANPSPTSKPEQENSLAWLPWLVAFFSLAAATAAVFWSLRLSSEIADLKTGLTKADAASAELRQQYQALLFAAREVAAKDVVRGRVIIRDASGKRVSLPGIRLRIYPRAKIESYLADRFAEFSDPADNDPARLFEHYLKNIPAPLENTTSDSDGRFEFKIPEPGEYVIQTSIRSQQTGQMRLWFVSFDSRDPLNTAVDITESNAVQQFNPLFMIVEGR